MKTKWETQWHCFPREKLQCQWQSDQDRLESR
jgi:hypothetical protein